MNNPKSIDDCFTYDGIIQLPRKGRTVENAQSYKCHYCTLATVRHYREGHLRTAHNEIYKQLKRDKPKYN